MSKYIVVSFNSNNEFINLGSAETKEEARDIMQNDFKETLCMLNCVPLNCFVDQFECSKKYDEAALSNESARLNYDTVDYNWRIISVPETKYDYLAETTRNVIDWIRNEENEEEWDDAKEKFKAHLEDVLWTEDSITGNGSGAFTFNRWTAEKYVKQNLPLVFEACRELGVEPEMIAKKFEQEDYVWLDVTVRCYLLPQAIDAAVECCSIPF